MAQSKVQQKAEALLEDLGVADVPAHPFYVFMTALERKSRRARWIYPAAYLALGIVFLLCVHWFAGVRSADMWKLVGAVGAVFSALLAFWKPNVTLTQEDATAHLPDNKRITAADLQDFNRILGLPSKKSEDLFKLAGALASFFAVYVLLT